MDMTRIALLGFLIIATCGRTFEGRSVAWVMVIVLSVILITEWVVGLLL